MFNGPVLRGAPPRNHYYGNARQRTARSAELTEDGIRLPSRCYPFRRSRSIESSPRPVFSEFVMIDPIAVGQRDETLAKIADVDDRCK